MNRKAAYTVHFETAELIGKCVNAIDRELTVSPLQYTVQRGEQTEEATVESLEKGEAFKLRETETTENRTSAHSAVRYDLLGTLAERTQLTRGTVAAVLTGIGKPTFALYKMNPEDFILKAARIINEQKATVIVEHLAYDPIEDRHDLSIFHPGEAKGRFRPCLRGKPACFRICLHRFHERAEVRRATRFRHRGGRIREAPKKVLHPDTRRQLQPRLGDRVRTEQGKARLLRRGNEGVDVDARPSGN